MEYWVKIVVYKGQTAANEKIQVLFWEGLLFAIRMKYDWYFKYRAALLQVKYPKYLVEFTYGNAPPSEKNADTILKNKIRAKKSKITEIENKLSIARNNWTDLFPIEEDSLYIKCVQKLERLKCELKELLKD